VNASFTEMFPAVNQGGGWNGGLMVRKKHHCVYVFIDSLKNISFKM
jgi:hypothetical protein